MSTSCIASGAFAQPAKSNDPGSASTPPKAAEQDPAAALLKNVAEHYASAKTYSDKGEITSTLDVNGRAITSHMPFSTAFERNGRFFWEFRSSPVPGQAPTEQYKVWSHDQKTFKSHWTLDNAKTDSFDSMHMALAGPTGISSGQVLTIIPLLCRDLPLPARTTDLKNAKLIGKERIDNQDCTKVMGKGLGNCDETLWIDASLAIRRIKEDVTVDPSKIQGAPNPHAKPFQVLTVIDFKPIFDEKLPDSAFEPPEK
ncbi:MAG: hypothetical protein GC200_02345 [Tepidisphaera sp.]|nr:hypothetical protein [Tepidisphaera sp.]